MKRNFKSIQQKRNRSKIMNDNSNDNMMDTIKNNKNVRRTRTRNVMWTTGDKNMKTRNSGKSIRNQDMNDI